MAESIRLDNQIHNFHQTQATTLNDSMAHLYGSHMPLWYCAVLSGPVYGGNHLNRSVRPSGNVRKLLCRLMA